MHLLLATLLTVTCIVWEDATGYADGWVQPEEMSTPEVVVSCGILVKEEDGHLYLAMDRAQSDGTVNSTGSIPLGWIKARHDMAVDAGTGTMLKDGVRTDAWVEFFFISGEAGKVRTWKEALGAQGDQGKKRLPPTHDGWKWEGHGYRPLKEKEATDEK